MYSLNLKVKYQSAVCTNYLVSSVEYSTLMSALSTAQGPISRIDLSLLLGLNTTQGYSCLSLSLLVKLAPGLNGMDTNVSDTKCF